MSAPLPITVKTEAGALVWQGTADPTPWLAYHRSGELWWPDARTGWKVVSVIVTAEDTLLIEVRRIAYVPEQGEET